MEASGYSLSSMQSSIEQGSTDDYEHSCGQCLVDDKNVEAYGFCADCPEYLCVTCFRAHTRNRASRHHQLQEMSNVTNLKKADVASKICTEKCSLHGLEIIKFYCPEHEALCCNDCVVLNHRHCKMDYIPEKCSEIDESVEYQETLNELDVRQKRVDNVKKVAEQVKEEIKKTTESIMDEIHVFEQELQEHIGKLRKNVESEVETKQAAKTQIVNTVLDTGNMMTSNIQQHQKEILDSKERNNLAQMFVAVKKAKRLLKVDEVNASTHSLGEIRTRFQFERNGDIENLTKSSTCFGTLKKDPRHICRDAIISRKKVDRHMISAAISIDTSYMTVGVSFVHDPKEIFYKKWQAEGMISTKVDNFSVPTSLLIKPDGQTVCAYGNEAEQKYEELVKSSEESNYYYFHRGYILNIYRDMDKKLKIVKDVSGKEQPSIFVLSTLIRILKDETVSCINKHSKESDIHFVITVPERFTTAMNVMKEAAEQAGIACKDLTIVYETEAALIYIQDSVNYDSSERSANRFPEGASYLVLDARDKIFTTTLYEVSGKNSMQIYHEAVEYCKDDSLNEEFEKFMSRCLGLDIWRKFRDTYPEGYRCILYDIELGVKRKYSNYIRFKDYRLPEIVEESTGGTLKDLICKQNNRGKLRITQISDKLQIDSCTVESFFQPAVLAITSQLHSVLHETSGLRCDAILMIGSFSANRVLQDGLKREFPDLKIVIPYHPEKAVLLGAVALGHYMSK